MFRQSASITQDDQSKKSIKQEKCNVKCPLFVKCFLSGSSVQYCFILLNVIKMVLIAPQKVFAMLAMTNMPQIPGNTL